MLVLGIKQPQWLNQSAPENNVPAAAPEVIQEFEATEIADTQELVEMPTEPEARPTESVDPNRPLRRKK